MVDLEKKLAQILCRPEVIKPLPLRSIIKMCNSYILNNNIPIIPEPGTQFDAQTVWLFVDLVVVDKRLLPPNNEEEKDSKFEPNVWLLYRRYLNSKNNFFLGGTSSCSFLPWNKYKKNWYISKLIMIAKDSITP